MPLWIQAIVLGVVQGLTEFIPVSSSGHLVIVPYLAGWEPPGLVFDVALHLGTAAAVIVFFRRELVAMARGLLTRKPDADALIYRRLAVLVVIASLPVAIVGLLFEDAVAEAFESPLLVAGFLLVTAALLALGERRRTVRVKAQTRRTRTGEPGRTVWRGSWIGEQQAAAPAPPMGLLPVGDDAEDPAGTSLEGMSLRHAVTIGLLQAVAILPGVSRSGSTISGGIMSGLTREAATRFSFLLSLPALIGAFVLSLPDLSAASDFTPPMVVAGVVAAFISGYIAVRFLVALVARDRLTGFARYCVFVAVLTLIAYQFLGPPSVV
jgi:undecaprenyl-diphosphatase